MYYGYIYKITNIQNNKIYIGKTTHNVDNYIHNHFLCASCLSIEPTKYFYKSIRKYGKHNFKYIVLGKISARTKEKLNYKLNIAEKDVIYFYRSFGSDGKNFDNIYGYNMTSGGEGIPGLKHSEKNITMFRERMKNDPLNPFKFGFKGDKNGMYKNGKIISGKNHFLSKMSKNDRKIWIKKNKIGVNNPSSKKWFLIRPNKPIIEIYGIISWCKKQKISPTTLFKYKNSIVQESPRGYQHSKFIGWGLFDDESKIINYR